MPNLNTSYPNVKCHWTDDPRENERNSNNFSKTAYFTETVTVHAFQQGLFFDSSVKVIPPGRPPLRKINDIESFSKNSRSRLFKFFSTVSFSDYHKVYFTTLTYHNDWSNNQLKIKTDLDNFLKRIARYSSGIDWMWRIELQKRKAPHFHLIFFIRKDFSDFRDGNFQSFIWNAWLNFKPCKCQYCRKHAVVTEELEHYRKAIGYVSKYVAKEIGEKTDDFTGRRWGYKSSLLRRQIDIFDIKLCRFILLKKLLYNFYKEEVSKREYIRENINSFYSWFVFADTLSLGEIFRKVICLPMKNVFELLQAFKLIPDRYVYDEDNILISDYLADNN